MLCLSIPVAYPLRVIFIQPHLRPQKKKHDWHLYRVLLSPHCMFCERNRQALYILFVSFFFSYQKVRLIDILSMLNAKRGPRSNSLFYSLRCDPTQCWSWIYQSRRGRFTHGAIQGRSNGSRAILKSWNSHTERRNEPTSRVALQLKCKHRSNKQQTRVTKYNMGRNAQPVLLFHI